MGDDFSTREYRPVLTSRVGEVFAWLSVLTLAAAGNIIHSESILTASLPLLSVIVGIMAASISFSNWMDRKTLLRLKAEGISFTNGLRRVNLNWGDIEQISVFSGSLGKKVQVVSGIKHFEFRMLSDVELLGRTRGRLGFPHGSEILDTMLEHTGMELAPSDRSDTIYYTRQ